jgi:uncharacterized protein YukE
MRAAAQKVQQHVQGGQDYQYDLKQWLDCAQSLPGPLRDNVTTSIHAWDTHVQAVYGQLHTLAINLQKGATDMQSTDAGVARGFSGQ